MPETRTALLDDRGVVAVTGADAHKLLQGLITNDMDRVRDGNAIHAALLTPQGKILFAFFVAKTENGYLLETSRDSAQELARRLTFYKLRAAVTIEDVSPTLAVAASWNGGEHAGCAGKIRFTDPRHAGLGSRSLSPLGATRSPTASQIDYLAHRVALGVPEAGVDYALGDTFPHEADFDLFHGVDFDKGCFVGQEIVARMQHKSAIRKRIVRVKATSDLPANHPDVEAGGTMIGRLGSVAGGLGLAMLRLDRVAEALEKAHPIAAAGIAIDVDADAIAAWRAVAASRAAP